MKRKTGRPVREPLRQQGGMRGFAGNKRTDERIILEVKGMGTGVRRSLGRKRGMSMRTVTVLTCTS
jgi:hypothetical protein